MCVHYNGNMKLGKKILGVYTRNKRLEERVSTYLENVPKSHLQGLRGIYVPFFLEDPDGRGKRDNAFYHSEKKEINLGPTRVKFPSEEYRLYHELGHHVFRYLLMAQLKEKWNACVDDLRKDEEQCYKLFLNMSSNEEFFASQYANFIMK